MTAGVKPPFPNSPNTSRDIPLGLLSRKEEVDLPFGPAFLPNELVGAAAAY